MPNPQKQNASGKGGASIVKLGGGDKGQNKVLRCGSHHISKLRKEIDAARLGLRGTSASTQCDTLIPIFQYLGNRGLNTPEAVGLGFYRIATRVQELEADGWHITVARERMLGADGLVHLGIARYRLTGRHANYFDPQARLDLGVA
jgi:hypothetical protein